VETSEQEGIPRQFRKRLQIADYMRLARSFLLMGFARKMEGHENR